MTVAVVPHLTFTIAGQRKPNVTAMQRVSEELDIFFDAAEVWKQVEMLLLKTFFEDTLGYV